MSNSSYFSHFFSADFFFQLTPPFFFHLLSPFGQPSNSLLFFLFFSAPMKVFNHHTHEHVKYEKSDQQYERNKVQKSPFRIIFNWLCERQEIDLFRFFALNKKLNDFPYLLINSHRVQSRVHYVHPSVSGR